MLRSVFVQGGGVPAVEALLSQGAGKKMTRRKPLIPYGYGYGWVVQRGVVCSSVVRGYLKNRDGCDGGERAAYGAGEVLCVGFGAGYDRRIGYRCLGRANGSCKVEVRSLSLLCECSSSGVLRGHFSAIPVSATVESARLDWREIYPSVVV